MTRYLEFIPTRAGTAQAKKFQIPSTKLQTNSKSKFSKIPN